MGFSTNTFFYTHVLEVTQIFGFDGRNIQKYNIAKSMDDTLDLRGKDVIVIPYHHCIPDLEWLALYS